MGPVRAGPVGPELAARAGRWPRFTGTHLVRPIAWLLAAMGVLAFIAGWVGFGLGPLVGGLLNDPIAPVATWYGGVILRLAAAGGYLILAGQARARILTAADPQAQ